MADLNVALILRFVDQATRPARAAMGEVERVAGASQRIGGQQVATAREQISAAQQRQGAMLGEAAALAGIGFAMSQALRPAIAFESKMAGVGKVVDFEAPDGLAQLGRDIQALTTDGGLPMAAEGIADIVAAAAQANLIDQALPDAEKRAQLIAFADAAAKMGVAFDISAAEAGKAMAVWRASLGMTQEEALSLGDAVNYLSNNMNAEASALTDVIQRQGGVAKAAGLANAEVAALSAALLSGGAGPDVAATALKNFTGALTAGEAATDRQNSVFKKLGVDAVDLAKRMQVDAKGAILDVVGALGKLDKYEQGTAIRQLFGEEVAGSVTPLVANINTLRTAFGLVADEAAYAGAMTKEYGVIADTTESKLTVMGNRMADIAVVLGTALLPSFVALLEAVTPAVRAFGEFAAAHPAVVQGVAAVAGALFAVRVAAFMGRFAFLQLSIVWAVLRGALGAGLWAFGAAAKAVLWLGRAFIVAGRFMVANPIIAVIAAIAGLAYVIYQNWDGVVAFFTEKIERVRAAFDEGLLRGVLTALAEFNPFRLILEGAVNLIEYLTGWDLSFVTDKIAAVFDFSLFDAGVRLLQSAWDGMTSILEPMVGAISARLSAIVPDWMLRAWNWVAGGDEEPIASGASGRALGGPVRAGQIYRWMEEGEEMFSPRVDGNVVSARELSALRAGGGRRGGTTVSVGDIVINAAPGQSAAEIARAVRREIERLASSRGGELHDGGAYAA